jgi:prepilin-type processing-associated H-X9-DG protein
MEPWIGTSEGWIFPNSVTLDPSGGVPTINWFVGSEVVNVSNHYGAPYSFHPGGAQLGMGDGSVRFLVETTPVEVIGALSSCNGGEANAQAP